MKKFFCLCFIFLYLFKPHSIFGDNIGLLITATGKYISFVDSLIESAEKHFCKDHKVTYYVFTDSQMISNDKVVYVYQQRLGWPYDTMMRFEIYANNSDLFAKEDYLFACDADMLFVDCIGNEILSNRVGTIHPGFYNKSRNEYSYETDPTSLACIFPNEGTIYFAGGFYGGSREEFHTLITILSDRIRKDLNNGIIAVWHDESHLNRYFIDFEPTLKLSPSYCYPESWKLPYTPRLIALDKNHAEIRQ